MERFRAFLESEVHGLRPNSELVGASRALDRLLQVAEGFPPVLALLIEPWLDRLDKDPGLLQDVEDGIRVHLYARILDDAMDEGLPAQKAMLLAAQRLLWKAVAGITLRHPGLQEKTLDLVRITLESVQREDLTGEVRYWALKNHHLLLIPMLCTDDGPGYRACEEGFSSLLAMLQAVEERAQGRFSDPRTTLDFYQSYASHLDPARLETLAAHGWRGAADRIVREARAALP